MLNSYYKYTNIATAKAILENHSFRFSSPLNFNDPFDIQTKMYTEFDVNNLTDIVLSRIEQYVTGKIAIPDSKNDSKNHILILKQSLTLTGTTFNQIKEQLTPLVEDIAERIKNSVSYHNSAWLRGMTRSRVFCVTEEKNNLLMWAHYAQDHKGVVFELENISDANNILSNIKKVTYGEKPVSYFTLDEIFDWMFFLIDPDFEKILYQTYACYKSNHWDYENEWRVFYDTKNIDNSTLYFDMKFNPSQLKSISFGCNSISKDIVDISKMAKLINPKIELYKAAKMDNKFELFFERI